MKKTTICKTSACIWFGKSSLTFKTQNRKITLLSGSQEASKILKTFPQ